MVTFYTSSANFLQCHYKSSLQKMLPRSGISAILRRSAQLPRYSVRPLSVSIRLRNENQDTSKPKTTLADQEAVPKKKPLSRIAIGGTASQASKSSSGSIEFATWKAAALVLTLGGALYYFFAKEKRRLEIEKEAEANRGYGKPCLLYTSLLQAIVNYDNHRASRGY